MGLELLESSSASGYVPFPPDVVLDDRTGQPPVSSELLALDGTLPMLRTYQTHVVNALNPSLVGALLARHEPRGANTSYGTVFIVEPSAFCTFVTYEPFDTSTIVVKLPLSKAVSGFASRIHAAVAKRGSTEVLTPADELRSLTRLPPAMLADVFGVSRTTFYKWIEGATPRDERFQHLVDTLIHIKDAKQRLPSSIELGSWLRTPISPGGKTPLGYLRERRFTVFRGLILRAASTSIALTPVASSIPTRASTREERAIERERVSPSPRTDEDEE
jgi:hypothetical protein